MNRRVTAVRLPQGERWWMVDLLQNGKRYRSGAAATLTKAVDAAVNFGRRR